MKRRSSIFLALTLLTAILIFFFSAQDGEDSSALSGGITMTIVRLIRPDFDRLPPAERERLLSTFSFYVRKVAHFSEFALLGFNLACYLVLRNPERASWFGRFGLAWLLSTLYACTDELHQMFVADRGPAFTDVLIDSAGALFGVLIAWALSAFIAVNRRE